MHAESTSEIMKPKYLVSLFLSLWAGVVLVVGGVLTSYHQPFLTPDEKILSLARPSAHNQWQVIHIVSGGCVCSQRVMQHLLERHPVNDVAEQILVVDGPAPYLPDTDRLLERLQSAGFPLIHLAAKDIPESYGLRGVPLLIIVSPQRSIAYLGGYGPRGDQDIQTLQLIRSGRPPTALPILGCAIGQRLRRQADPFGLKYSSKRTD
jgi:hypothetical protein